MRILIIVAIAALGLTGCGAPAAEPSSSVASVSTPAAAGQYRGLQLEVPLARPSFTLTDDAGQAYDFLARTQGKPTLLFFGYTNCPDICPTTMADVATAIRGLPSDLAGAVQVVFVTTDPANDTGPVLTEFLDHFDGDLPNGFIGLTGTIEQVEAAQRAARVTVAQDMGTSHSAQLQLYGTDDLARVVYVGGSSPDDIVHDLPLVSST
ncbi:MAG: SCO family protein [Geodermatophilaceae bacterium]|nr:SCO family protein [Geodermatophilaceae bacterium]